MLGESPKTYSDRIQLKLGLKVGYVDLQNLKGGNVIFILPRNIAKYSWFDMNLIRIFVGLKNMNALAPLKGHLQTTENKKNPQNSWPYGICMVCPENILSNTSIGIEITRVWYLYKMSICI